MSDDEILSKGEIEKILNQAPEDPIANLRSESVVFSKVVLKKIEALIEGAIRNINDKNLNGLGKIWLASIDVLEFRNLNNDLEKGYAIFSLAVFGVSGTIYLQLDRGFANKIGVSQWIKELANSILNFLKGKNAFIHSQVSVSEIFSHIPANELRLDTGIHFAIEEQGRDENQIYHFWIDKDLIEK